MPKWLSKYLIQAAIKILLSYLKKASKETKNAFAGASLSIHHDEAVPVKLDDSILREIRADIADARNHD